MMEERKYKVWTWKHILVLHWIVNPGLAINELVFGQRVPKKMLVEQNCSKSLAERSFVPCPHCDTIHDARVWNVESNTAFRNWFGLYCMHCGGIIPCLRNATSFLLIWVCSPLWLPFYKNAKAKWLAAQPERYARVDVNNLEVSYNWVSQGLTFGTLMLIFNTLLDLNEFEWKHLLIKVPLWILGGLLYGYIMKLFMHQANKKPTQNAS